MCITVIRDLESNGVYAGLPVRSNGLFNDFVEKCPASFEEYDYLYVGHNQNISEDEILNEWKVFNSYFN